MRNFLINLAGFLVWSFGLFTIALAPIVFDGPEAIAAMLAAAVAVFSIGIITFWSL
jgi:hypothetical protein